MCLSICYIFLLITDSCFQTGAYDEKYNIDSVGAIASAEDCQEQCKLIDACHFWTYNSMDNICWRQTADAPEGTSPCDLCTRGPRDCQGKTYHTTYKYIYCRQIGFIYVFTYRALQFFPMIFLSLL